MGFNFVSMRADNVFVSSYVTFSIFGTYVPVHSHKQGSEVLLYSVNFFFLLSICYLNSEILMLWNNYCYLFENILS